MELQNIAKRAHNSRYYRETELPKAKARHDQARAELRAHLVEHGRTTEGRAAGAAAARAAIGADR